MTDLQICPECDDPDCTGVCAPFDPSCNTCGARPGERHSNACRGGNLIPLSLLEDARAELAAAVARAEAAEKRAREIGLGPGNKWWADGYKEIKAQLDILTVTLPMQDPRRMAKRIRMQRREMRRLLAFVDRWSKSHCKQAAYLRLQLNRAEAERAAAQAENTRLKEALDWSLDHVEESALQARNSPGIFAKARSAAEAALAGKL